VATLGIDCIPGRVTAQASRFFTAFAFHNIAPLS
jgi:hypothetical protein